MGMREQTALSRAALFERARAALGQADAFCWVPGRVEVLGKHVDYGGGRSLVAAIERGLCFAFRARTDQVLRVTSSDTGEQIECPLREDVPQLAGWGNYVSTIAHRLAKNFGNLRGADVAFASDLPPAAGLSSSSALLIGLFFAVEHGNQLLDRELLFQDRLNLASYLGCVENGRSFAHLAGNRGVGTFGGSQDQTAILNCMTDRMSQFAYCPLRREGTWPMPDHLTFAVASSGVHAAKTQNALEQYNSASVLLAKVLQIWNEKRHRSDSSLMDALQSTPDAVEFLRSRLTLAGDSRLVDRFEHFVAETLEIIPAARRAWFSQNLGDFALQVDRSQRLAEQLLGNQVAETVALARLAREKGAIAASAFGAGFGGSVWAMISRDDAEQFLHSWQCSYVAAFPQHADHARFFLTRPGISAAVFSE